MSNDLPCPKCGTRWNAPAPQSNQAGVPDPTLCEITGPGAPVDGWDADALASMLSVWSDEHPYPAVQRAMCEAARRLRALPRPVPPVDAEAPT